MKHFRKLKSPLKLSTKTGKSVFFALALAFIAPMAMSAQTAQGFGFKGGLNYNANGDYFESVSDTWKTPDRNVGYHVGVFGKIGDKLYLRPELVYTSTKSDYDDDSFKMQKLDAPVLVGANILGPLSIFAGPSFQYILDTEFEGVTIGDVKNDFTVGLNFGVGLNFNKLGIDLRYERGFSDKEANFIYSEIGENDRLDTRPDQLILSLSLML